MVTLFSLETLESRVFLSTTSGPGGNDGDNSGGMILASSTSHPSVAGVRPANGASNVSRDTYIACDVKLVASGAGVDALTLAGNVRLVRASDGASVPGTCNTTGGGDEIIFSPARLLDGNATYNVIVT